MIPNKAYIYYRNQVILNLSSFQNLFSTRTACHMIPKAFISHLSDTRGLCVNHSFEIFDEYRPDYRGDNRHIENLSMKLRAKERIRFIEN